MRFELPTAIRFGTGEFHCLPTVVSKLGFKQVAFITTPGRYSRGVLDEPITTMDKQGITTYVFDEVVQNPHMSTVASCIEFLFSCQPDMIIGVGGGSPLDTAKAAGICFTNNIRDPSKLTNTAKLEQPTLPTILIPTTAGTGTEVNYWAVVTDEKNNQKLSVGHPNMVPQLALVDPELTLTMPTKVTIETGLDALTHAVESYLSSESDCVSEMFSLQAVSLIVDSVECAVEQGDNLSAREEMSLASLLAGIAMNNAGLGLIHAMSHQVSGFHDTPHGLANAALFIPVLRFNGVACQPKLQTLDHLVNGDSRFMEWLADLIATFELTRERIAITEKNLDTMVARAKGNVNVSTNPRIPTESEILNLYGESFKIV